MDWATFLASAVIAAAVSSLISLYISEHSIRVKYVTGERAKWREKVREKALAVHQAVLTKDKIRLGELELEFRLILNPLDPEDERILDLMVQMCAEESANTALREFGERLTLLLKHDWERAKWEAKTAWCRSLRPPVRIRHEEFLASRDTSMMK